MDDKTDRSAAHTDDEHAEARATKRVPLQCMVTYRLGGQEYGNLAADVSPDGIFIRTFMPPPVDTHLELTLSLPDTLGGFKVDLEGRVARVVKGDDPRHNGMGIQFLAIHATDVETVRQLVCMIFRMDVLTGAR